MKKLVIPKIRATIRYINSELDEREREEMFRLKRFKEYKDKASIATVEVKKEDYFLSRKASSYYIFSTIMESSSEEHVFDTPPVMQIGDITQTKPELSIVQKGSFIEKGICEVCANKQVDDFTGSVCPFCVKRKMGETNELCPVCAHPEEFIESKCPICRCTLLPGIEATCEVCRRKPFTGELCAVCDDVPPEPVKYERYQKTSTGNMYQPQLSDTYLDDYKTARENLQKSSMHYEYEEPVQKEVFVHSKSERKSEENIFQREYDDLGTFETKYEEIVRVVRLQNDDGSIAQEKQIIRVTTERKNMPNDDLTVKAVNEIRSRYLDKPNTKDASTCCSRAGSPITSFDKQRITGDISICPRCHMIQKMNECKNASTVCSHGSNYSSPFVTVDVINQKDLVSTEVDAGRRDATATADLSGESDFIIKVECENKNADTQTNEQQLGQNKPSERYFTIKYVPIPKEKYDVQTKTSIINKKKCQFCGNHLEKKTKMTPKRAQSSTVCRKRKTKDVPRQTKSCPSQKVCADAKKRLLTLNKVSSKEKTLGKRLQDVLSEHSKSELISVESYDTTKSKSCSCAMSGSAFCIASCPVHDPQVQASQSKSLKSSKCICPKPIEKCMLTSCSVGSNTVIDTSTKAKSSIECNTDDDIDLKLLKESTMKLFYVDDIKEKASRETKKNKKIEKNVSIHDKCINVLIPELYKLTGSCPHISRRMPPCQDMYKTFPSCPHILLDFYENMKQDDASSVHQALKESQNINVNSSTPRDSFTKELEDLFKEVNKNDTVDVQDKSHDYIIVMTLINDLIERVGKYLIDKQTENESFDKISCDCEKCPFSCDSPSVEFSTLKIFDLPDDILNSDKNIHKKK